MCSTGIWEFDREGDAPANAAPAAYDLPRSRLLICATGTPHTVTAKEHATPPEPTDGIDIYIDATAEMLALPLQAAWKPAVKANLLVNLRRTLSRTAIATYGRDFAVASTLFHRESAPGKVGRQMQTWVRFPEGWRVVAAHVSVIPDPANTP